MTRRLRPELAYLRCPPRCRGYRGRRGSATVRQKLRTFVHHGKYQWATRSARGALTRPQREAELRVITTSEPTTGDLSARDIEIMGKLRPNAVLYFWVNYGPTPYCSPGQTTAQHSLIVLGKLRPKTVIWACGPSYLYTARKL
uniref:Uncharacterized protein n=1 Tax=Timema poppense TaxID=170557 RepID=A0A7R9HAE4_TIMPO|nr:unnamed protein product [Timema poppensis]